MLTTWLENFGSAANAVSVFQSVWGESNPGVGSPGLVHTAGAVALLGLAGLAAGRRRRQ